MRINKIVIINLIFLLFHNGLVFSENIKYFKIDKIIKITGKIIKIKTDTKEHSRDFIVIELENRENGFYSVEVSPKWFYNVDMFEGDIIDVKGSLNIIKKKNIILTQSIVRQGEIFNFRDKLGFPLWRSKGYGKGPGKKGFKRQRRQKRKY